MKLFSIFLLLYSTLAVAEVSTSKDLILRQWTNLLHYIPNVNSEHELSASLKALRSDQAQKFKCRYPARYYFLREHFQVPKLADCEGIEDWKEFYQLKDIKVVFAAQFFSDPASILGHTFFLLNSNYFARNLQISLSYAALTPKNVNLATYVWKGLTGGFQGRYTVLPFIERTKLYNLVELRDLWLYTLNLTKKEKDLFNFRTKICNV